MSHDPRQGRIRWRLTLLLVAAVTVPLLAGLFAVRRLVGASLEDGIYDYHASVIGEVGALVDAEVDAVIEQVGRVSAALTTAADPREAESAAIATLERLPDVDVVGIYAADGASRAAVLAKSKVEAPVAPATIAERFPELAQGAVKVTGATVLAAGASAGRWPVAVPLLQGNEHFGWVYAEVDLTSALSRLDTLAKARYAGTERPFVLLDEGGKLFGQPEGTVPPSLLDQLPKNQQSGALQLTTRVQGALAYEDPELGPAFARIDVLPRLRLAVIARQSEAETFATIHRVTTFALVAVLVLAVLAALTAAWVARRATRPLARLVDGAQAIGQAKFDVRVDVKANDEIEMLADAINAMARDLGSYEKRLVEETRLRSSVSRYVSKDVVDLIASGRASLELGGQRQKVTIVFIDIVSFTPLSEQFPPEKIITVVNAMFTMMTAVVWKYGGTVDKFIGDCMMAIWGSPYVKPGDETRAALAMREILRSMGPVNELAERVFGRKLELTCGMNTGEAVVGNVGSEQRMEFTVIGDAVNVAARVQAQAVPGQILVTLATADAIGDDVPLVDRGERKVKGKSEPIRIFEVPIWPDGGDEVRSA